MAKARRDSIHDARELPIFVTDDALIDRYGSQIGAYGVAVYVTLARFAKQSHTTTLAYQTVADILGISRTKARETLKALADEGLIDIVQQTDDAGNPIASNRYTLLPIARTKAETPHGGVPPHDTPVSPDDTPHAPHDSPYRHTHGGVSPHAYESHDSIRKESHDLVGVGVGRSREFLIDQGMSAADEFVDLPYESMRLDYDARRADGQTNAQIVKAWRLKPPTEIYHYERRSIQPSPAPRRNGRSAVAAPNPAVDAELAAQLAIWERQAAERSGDD